MRTKNEAADSVGTRLEVLYVCIISNQNSAAIDIDIRMPRRRDVDLATLL